MSLKNAIKRAGVALQMAVAPHENPAPVEGTQAATVQPATPDEERDLQEAHTNALRIVESLTRQSKQEQENEKYALDAQTRARIIYSLNRWGPPKSQFEEHHGGVYRTFEGGEGEKAPEQFPDRVFTGIEEIAVKSDHAAETGQSSDRREHKGIDGAREH